MNILLWGLVGFFVILGLAHFWESVLLLCWRPKTEWLRYELIPIQGSVDNVEQLCRYAEYSSSSHAVVFVDRGLDYASRELFCTFCRKHEGVFLLTEADVRQMIFMEKSLEPSENP